MSETLPNNLLVKELLKQMTAGAKNSYYPVGGLVISEHQSDGVVYHYQSDLTMSRCGKTFRVNNVGEVIIEDWQESTKSRYTRTGLSMKPEELHDLDVSIQNMIYEKKRSRLPQVISVDIPDSLIEEAYFR